MLTASRLSDFVRINQASTTKAEAHMMAKEQLTQCWMEGAHSVSPVQAAHGLQSCLQDEASSPCSPSARVIASQFLPDVKGSTPALKHSKVSNQSVAVLQGRRRQSYPKLIFLLYDAPCSVMRLAL